MRAHLLLAPLLGVAILAQASTDCPQHYLTRKEPKIVAPLSGDMIEICYDEYAVLYSVATHTPLYTAENMTPAEMRGADRISRDKDFQFFEDRHLPESVRSTLDDYSRSGFDKGHMAPAGDFSNMESQHQSFSLANVVPQSAAVNRGVWARIEASVRTLAKDGPVYVVTGPIFLGSAQYLKGGHVMIPSHVFKAVYAPKSRVVGAYIAGNADDQTYYTVSLKQLVTMTGIDVFPDVPDNIKEAHFPLPPPKQFNKSFSARFGFN